MDAKPKRKMDARPKRKMDPKTEIQWGSENWTGQNCEYSKDPNNDPLITETFKLLTFATRLFKP